MSSSSKSKSVTIEIPNYITEVKVSNARRAKNFKKGDKIPLKYQNDGYIWKNNRLFDVVSKTYVIKNAISVGKPRYQKIAGNEIYARMHERLRMLIVKAIKENYTPHLPTELNLKYPISLELTLHTHPNYLNWDVDNLWIYIKCFQDLLKDKSLIPDDDIRYIKSSGKLTFVPIVGSNLRKLEFKLTELPKSEHIMYNLEPKNFKFHNTLIHTSAFRVTRTTDGSVGDIITNVDENIFYINVGKKKISEIAVEKTLIKVFHQCIHYDIKEVSINEPFYLHYKEHLIKNLLNRGIEIHVHKVSL